MLIAGTQEFMLFCLIMMRMAGFIFLNPVLGRRNIPAMAKTGMVLALSILIFSVESVGDIPDISSAIEFGFLLFKEFFMGFVMQLFAFAVTYAGSIIDFQMALGMASTYDAQNGVQIALTGNILNIFFMLLFFAVDGHLALMDILVTSADIVPYAQASLGTEAAQNILDLFYKCILLAVRLGFPVIGIVLVLDIGVGILMKIIPQINLFILDIPMKILLGFATILFLASPVMDYLGTIISEMMKAVQEALGTLV